jgi:hypothetical protein
MLNLKTLLQLWKSLIYKGNIRGPNTDPCGTPYLIEGSSDLICLIHSPPQSLLVKLRNIRGGGTNYVIVSQNAQGIMGRRKLRKDLPYNVSKMASNYRLRILHFLIFRLLMNYSWRITRVFFL